jgi:hypothetical protein
MAFHGRLDSAPQFAEGASSLLTVASRVFVQREN